MRSPRPRTRKSGQIGRLTKTFRTPTKNKLDGRLGLGRFDSWGSVDGYGGPREELEGESFAKQQTSAVTGLRSVEDTPGGDAAPEARSRTSAPRSLRVSEFVHMWSQRALTAWLESEKGPRVSTCGQCSEMLEDNGGITVGESAYRCVDCFTPPVLCKSCMLEAHRRIPFHCVERWDVTRGFWQRKQLGNLGMTLDLGHGGQMCPLTLGEGRTMTVVHSHGIQDMRVRFCACLDDDLQETPHALQLITHGMWPGSWDKPRTAFTVEVLKDFHLLSLQGQLNAQDFHRYLQRRTNNIQPDQIADRYRELLASMQEFIWLRSVKRAGVQPARHMPTSSLAVLCPSCPQPGMNMDPVWKTRSESMTYLDALFTSVDGNFHQNQREKPNDPDDFALSEGAAYFADVQDFATYQKALGPLEREPSTCHKFGAMGYGGYGGRVSGTVGLSCARHMFVLPGGGVDLQKGERFANVDFAMISGLQRWMPLRLIIAGYDINCQYHKKFPKRMKWFEDNRGARMSIQNTRFPAKRPVNGAGMTDGEAPERIWAVLNGLAARTREMAAGHRHDIINDHHSDMNVRRTHNMARFLTGKHDEAVAQLHAMEGELTKLESHLPPEKLSEWKQQEAEYLRKVVDPATHTGLQNPYEVTKATAPSRKQILTHLNQQSSSITGARRRERRGLIGMLEEGIELETLRLELAEELQGCSSIENLDEELRSKIKRVQSRMEVWQELRDLYWRPLLSGAWEEWRARAENGEGSNERAGAEMQVPAGEVDKPTGIQELDDVRIDLPSTCDRSLLQCESLKEATSLELRLREGQANDALADARVHLITKYALKQQQKEVVGQVPMTRSRQHLKRKGEAVERAAKAYRRARLAILALMPNPEGCSYRELHASDLVSFAVRDEERVLGDSRKVSSWIWDDSSWLENSANGTLKTFVADAMRVHWFRRSALKARWTEEKLLVEEEMGRTLRYWQHWQCEWEYKSEEDLRKGCHGEAAYGRKQAFRYEQLRKVAMEAFTSRIDVAMALATTDGYKPGTEAVTQKEAESMRFDT